MTPLDLPDDTAVILEQRPLLVNDGEGLGVEQPWTRAEMTLAQALDEIRDERAPTIWRVHHDPTCVRSSLYASFEGDAHRLDHPSWTQPGRPTVDWLRAWSESLNSVTMVEGLSELDITLAALAVLQIARAVYNDEGVPLFLLELRECLHTKTTPRTGSRSSGRDYELRDMIRQVLAALRPGLRSGTQQVLRRIAWGSCIRAASVQVRLHCQQDRVPMEGRVDGSPFWKERLTAHAAVLRSVVSPDMIYRRLRQHRADRLLFLRGLDANRRGKQMRRKAT